MKKTMNNFEKTKQSHVEKLDKIYSRDKPFKTLADLGVEVETKDFAKGMCTLYDNVDARITKNIVTFGPIDAEGEHIYQLRIDFEMLKAIVIYMEELDE